MILSSITEQLEWTRTIFWSKEPGTLRRDSSSARELKKNIAIRRKKKSLCELGRNFDTKLFGFESSRFSGTRHRRGNFRFGIFGSIRSRYPFWLVGPLVSHQFASAPSSAVSSRPGSILLRRGLIWMIEKGTKERESQAQEWSTTKWILIVVGAPRDCRWLRRYSCYPWLKPEPVFCASRRALRKRLMNNAHR